MTPLRGSRSRGLTDAALLALVAAGNLAALGDVYDAHAAEVARFAQLRVPPAEVDDVVQDTFVRVSRIAGTYDGRSPNARAWIFGIAVAIVRERRRAFSRLTRVLERVASHASPGATSRGESIDLERGLEKLSEPKREVLLLTEVHGFSGEEVAAMLGIPVGTVWTRLHHARRELRDILGGKP